MDLEKSKLQDMYLKMLHIRRFEEKGHIFHIGKGSWYYHLYVGRRPVQ